MKALTSLSLINTNIPEYTLAVLCDLSKVFDVIKHDIL